MSGRTPDSFPGVRLDEGIILDPIVSASQEGEMRYISGSFSFYDSQGEFNPRSSGSIQEQTGSLPTPQAVGQVLFALTTASFDRALPITSKNGWLANRGGYLLVRKDS